MTECPYCSTSIDPESDFNFCIKCFQQIRCTRCMKELKQDVPICLYCGTSVSESTLEQTGNQVNRYYLEEETTETTASRKIEFTFTDTAIEKAAPLFGSQFPLPQINPQKPIPIIKDQAALPEPMSSSAETEANDQQSAQTIVAQDSELDDDKSLASKMFIDNGEGILIAEVPDFKGETFKEQQIRFILLYTWAYSLVIGNYVPDRKHFTDAAKVNKIFTKNLRVYFSPLANECLTLIGQTYKLNPSGQNRVEEILKDVENEDVPKGYPYWEGSKPRKKRASLTKEDKLQVDKWVEEETRCSDFETRSLEGAKWPMFILYDLTKELAVGEAIKPTLAYEYAKKRYPTLPLKKTQFTNAFSRPYNKDKFKRTNSGLYYLTTFAEEAVEQWLLHGDAVDGGDSSG